MEQDVVARAADFLSATFGERLSDADRHALEHWMTSRIEDERRGWKSTLQRSLQEVERERKSALDAHAAVQGVNERLEARMETLGVPREASEYACADQDSRVYTLSALERNVGAVLHCLTALLDDQRRCWACVQGGDEDSPDTSSLFEAVSGKMADLTGDAETTAREYRRQVSELREELAERARIDETRLQRHLQEVDALSEIIARQRSRLDAGNQRNSREAGTQTGNQLSVRYHHVTTQTLPSDADEADRKSASRTRMPAPIRSVTISRTVDQENGRRRWLTHTQDFEPLYDSTTTSTPGKHSDEFLDAKSDRSKGRSSARSLDASDVDRRHTIDTLRGQVIEFAEKLERAKDEVERYQRQLAWMKATPHSTLLNKELNNIRNSHQKDDAKYQDGFLSGTRKDLLPVGQRGPDVVLLRSELRRRRGFVGGGTNSTTRCLRCHGVYKHRDNHRKACRYHPRGKKKIEKYDGHGKLVTVTYLWECCLQATDAAGCSSGEHI